MSPIRAYYLPADPASAIDASRPVGVEQLAALGYKMSFVVGSSPDEIDQAGRKLAQEIGYPVTQEGGIVQFSLDLEKNAGEIAPDMLALLTKVVESANSEICSTKETLIAITSGNPYFDVEDVTAGWVRVHFVPGTLVFVPAGAKYRLDFNEQNRETTGTAFFKETVSNHGYLTKNEIDNHPVRRAYLDAQALGQI